MNIIEKFLQAEIYLEGMYEDIINFIISDHIRNGEFEGNEYIIKKMDHTNFIIFSEYSMEDGQREIHFATSIYKHNLLKQINDYSLKKGIKILNIDY